MKALFSEAYGYTKYVVVQGGATDMVAKFSNTDTSGYEQSNVTIDKRRKVRLIKYKTRSDTEE